MDANGKFARFIKDKGLRQTIQREQVAGIFLKTERHLSTQELYELVRKRHKNIGYATVARTMKLMAEADLCNVVDFGDGVKRFEHKFGHEHHNHLICVKCGKFKEISSKRLEKLQSELVKKHDYAERSHRLEIFGICPACKKK
jgi:Fur family ferric uptake transcriptional regulator